MRTIKDFIYYRYDYCCKTTYFIAPILLLFMFLSVQYGMKPQGVASSFCMTAMVTFLLMVWLGYSYEVHEDVVMAQVVILRVNNHRIYGTAEILWQMSLAIMISAATVLYTVLIHVANSFCLFNRSLTVMDIIGAFLLITACGFVGGCVGSIFGPRVMSNRKLALLLMILIMVLTITKSGIIRQEAVMKYILWILPPIYDMTTLYTVHDRFSVVNTLYGVTSLCGYGVLTGIIRILIQKKKGF